MTKKHNNLVDCVILKLAMLQAKGQNNKFDLKLNNLLTQIYRVF